MATNKNITMKQFNGVDYDTLYPKTVASQVDGVYSKEETLSDGTKTAYGLGASATPDDVFAAMPNYFEPVGTIKTTVRTDLGDKWLLCNGDVIDPAVYPELSAMLPGADPRVDWSLSDNFPIQSSDTGVVRLVYVNGYYIAFKNGTNGQYWYATSLYGDWTEGVVLTSGSSLEFRNFKYVNGYWVACAYIPGASATDTIYYSPSLSGAWTQKRIIGDTRNFVGDIMYRNGYYIVCGYYVGDNSYSGFIRYATTLDGTWTAASITSVVALDKIKYENGYYIVTGAGHPSSSLYANNGDFNYTTDFTGTWTRKQAVSGSYRFDTRDIIYINGKWFLCGYRNSNDFYGRVYTCDTIDGSWKLLYNTGSSNYNYAYDMVYVNNDLIIRGSNYLLISSNPSSTQASFTNVSFNTNIGPIGYVDGTYFCGATFATGFYINTKNKLPTITTNRSYAYIKAKE